jgi:hypothetical protein
VAHKAVDLQKDIIFKEDGRYLIYYTFAPASLQTGRQTDRLGKKVVNQEKAEERK